MRQLKSPWWSECDVCKSILKDHAGSSPCCGAITYTVKGSAEIELLRKELKQKEAECERLRKAEAFARFLVNLTQDDHGHTFEDLFNEFCEVYKERLKDELNQMRQKVSKREDLLKAVEDAYIKALEADEAHDQALTELEHHDQLKEK